MVSSFSDNYRIYNKADWYWQSSLDGQIYGSKRGDFVEASDPDYQRWLGFGNTPTPWPKDVDGNETQESLDEVLNS